MKRILAFNALAAFMLGWLGAAVLPAGAANQTFALQPGDGADVTCSTAATVSGTPQKTHLDCAPPASSLAWISPAGVSNVRKSTGYTQYCDANGCGTSPGSYAFDCTGHAWQGRDDEDTEATVKFSQPIQVSGFDFWTADGREPPGSKITFDFFGASADSVGSEHPAIPGPSYTHVGLQLTATFPAPALAPNDNHLRHLSVTFAPVTVSYLAWYPTGYGTWPNIWALRLQVPAGTPKLC